MDSNREAMTVPHLVFGYMMVILFHIWIHVWHCACSHVCICIFYVSIHNISSIVSKFNLLINIMYVSLCACVCARVCALCMKNQWFPKEVSINMISDANGLENEIVFVY